MRVSVNVCMLSRDDLLWLDLFGPASVACWIDMLEISASHSRSRDLLFREICHTVFGDEVVAVDWNTDPSASSAI